jgi:hypothetical protein
MTLMSRLRLGFMAEVLLAALTLTMCLPAQAASRAAAKELVVMVPGTVNHLAPGGLNPEDQKILYEHPYFSADIVSTIEAQGFKVHVLRVGAAFGGIESNGKASLEELQDWYSQEFPQGGPPITLLGHSAGGFYSIYAAAHRGELPIRRILTVSTPFDGAELANLSNENLHLTKTFEEIYKLSLGLLDLRGLTELSTDAVRAFLDNHRVEPSISITSFGCSQERSPNPFTMNDARYLWPPLSATASLIGTPSDGVVSLKSTWGEQMPIMDAAGGPARFQAVKTVRCSLDHAEEILDYRLFTALGRYNVKYVQEEQRRYWSALIPAAGP